jgi:hypothetical protein
MEHQPIRLPQIAMGGPKERQSITVRGLGPRVNGMTNHKFNESTTSPRFPVPPLFKRIVEKLETSPIIPLWNAPKAPILNAVQRSSAIEKFYDLNQLQKLLVLASLVPIPLRRMSDKRNDQAVSSPKGEKLADPSKYRVVRCAQSPG